MTLKEYVDHANLIKELDCKVCGHVFKNTFEIVFLLRHDHCCFNCLRNKKIKEK
jgi:hypothetical protein